MGKRLLRVKRPDSGVRVSLTGRAAVIAALGLVLLACAPRVDTRGHVTDPDALRELAVGIHDQSDVKGMLGSPSAVSTFGDEVWYYIGERTERVAFFKPEVLERQIVAIRFGDDGTVKEIVDYNKDDGRELKLVKRQTPTQGHETTLLQELFGNIGRFTPAAAAQ